MESHFACAAGGFLLAFAIWHYATTDPSQLQQEGSCEEQIRADITTELQRTLEAERVEIEYRVKRECADKYHNDTKRRERDLAGAVHDRDSAKAARNYQVQQRLEADRLRRATETELRHARRELEQLEARQTLIEDANSKLRRDLKRQEGRHAATEHALDTLSAEHHTVLRRIKELQALSQDIELSESSAKIEMTKLQNHVKKLERQQKSHKTRKTVLETAVKDRDALLADNISSQAKIVTLRRQLAEFQGPNDAAAKYEAEKRRREAAEAKHSSLQQDHMQCANRLASANQKASESSNGAAANIKMISQLQDQVKNLTKEKDDAATAYASEKKELDTKLSQLEGDLKRSNKDLAAEKQISESLRKQLQEREQALPSACASAQRTADDFAQATPLEAPSDQQSMTEPEAMEVVVSHDAVSMDTEHTAPPVGTPSDIAQRGDVDMSDSAPEAAPLIAPTASDAASGSKPSAVPFNNSFSNAIPGAKARSTATGMPTPDEILAAIPSAGIAYKDLLQKFEARINGSKTLFYSMTKKVADIDYGKTNSVTRR